MRKLRFTFTIVIVFLCFGCSQVQVSPTANPTTSGVKFYGNDYGNILYSFEGTADGGYMFGGATNNSNGNAGQGFIQKCDQNGNVQWYKNYGDSLDDLFLAVHHTSDGGFIAAGSTNSIGNGARRQDFYNDAYLVKTDANGNTKWQKTFGNVYSDQFFDVAETPDNGFVAVGIIYDPTYSNCLYVVKTDQKGDTLWTRELYQGFYKSFGLSVAVGTNGDIGIAGAVVKSLFAADQDTDYAVFVLLSGTDGKSLDYQNTKIPFPEYKTWGSILDPFSFTNRTEKIISRPDGYILAIDLNTTPYSVMVFKVDFKGNILWQHPYSGFGGAYMNDAINNAVGGLLISGGTGNASGANSCWLLNIDQNGNPLWQTKVPMGGDKAIAVGSIPVGNTFGVGVLLSTPLAKHANFMGFMTIDENGKIIEKN